MGELITVHIILYFTHEGRLHLSTPIDGYHWDQKFIVRTSNVYTVKDTENYMSMTIL